VALNLPRPELLGNLASIERRESAGLLLDEIAIP